MTAGTEADGALAAALQHLADRLEAHLALAHVQVWDGPWQTLADPARVSVRAPAAFVSLAGFTLSRRARSRFRPGQLRAVAAGDPPHGFPAPGQGVEGGEAEAGPTALDLHAAADIAVTFLAAPPNRTRGASEVARLAEAAAPVLVGFALTDIRGASLYTPALSAKGLAAFVLTGRRDIELAPMTPPRAAVARVEAVTEVCGETERIALWSGERG